MTLLNNLDGQTEPKSSAKTCPLRSRSDRVEVKMGGKLGKQHTYVVSGACGADTRHVVEPKKIEEKNKDTRQIVEAKRRESLQDSIGSGAGELGHFGFLWGVAQQGSLDHPLLFSSQSSPLAEWNC